MTHMPSFILSIGSLVTFRNVTTWARPCHLDDWMQPSDLPSTQGNENDVLLRGAPWYEFCNDKAVLLLTKMTSETEISDGWLLHHATTSVKQFSQHLNYAHWVWQILCQLEINQKTLSIRYLVRAGVPRWDARKATTHSPLLSGHISITMTMIQSVEKGWTCTTCWYVFCLVCVWGLVTVP